MKLDKDPRIEAGPSFMFSLKSWMRLAAQIVNQMVDGKANIDSPTFTGTPSGPTPPSSDNSTRFATTAWAKLGLLVSLGTIGYIKLPTWLGGLMLQWGTTVATLNGSSATTITFPIAFPNSVYTALVANGSTALTLTHPALSGVPSLTSFIAVWSTGTAGAGAISTRTNWVAFGS